MVEESTAFNFDESPSTAFKNVFKKKPSYVEEKKSKNASTYSDKDLVPEPVGNLFKRITGFHFGSSEADKKRMKKQTEEDIEREKTYLDML